MEVMGSAYPVPLHKAAAAKFVTAVQMATLGVTLGGQSAFQMLRLPPQPRLFDFLATNKMPVCIGAWFVGNMVGNSLTSTGAFEVYFDGKLIWSKLETGTMPNGNALFSALHEEAQEVMRRRTVDGAAQRAAGDAAAAEVAAAADEHLRDAGMLGDDI